MVLSKFWSHCATCGWHKPASGLETAYRAATEHNQQCRLQKTALWKPREYFAPRRQDTTDV
jgi:hypothetical protein